MMVSKEGQGASLSDKVSPINSYGMEMRWEFRNCLKTRESSLPDNQLKLTWISPVRDSVRVDCNRHVTYAVGRAIHPPVCEIKA